MNFRKYALCLTILSLMTACGGGGGSGSGNKDSTGVVVPDSTTATASDFIFELDKTSILNSGADKALLTVTAVDKNRNVVAGIPVTVSPNAGGVFAATSAAIKTDTSGKFSGTISIGGDKRDRTIDATITLNGIVKVASVVVSGSRISVTPVPATPGPGEVVTLNIATTDSAGNPIQNAELSLTGSAGAVGIINTNASGIRVASFTAPSTAGDYEVVVSGLGISTTKVVQVIAPGAGTVPAATGPVSSASLSPSPTSIPTNSAGTTTNRSKLSVKFQTTGNAGIQNIRVRFVIVPPVLGSGEAISVGDGTVYSDASGLAEADYISGSRSSPTNGVNVRACFKFTDFVASDFGSDGLCPSLGSVSASLTVAGAPLSISISDDNKLEKGLGSIAYLKKFLIQVNDSAGVAVKDAVVTASVDITHYGKGTYGGIYPLGTTPPSIVDTSLAVVQVSPDPIVAGVVTPQVRVISEVPVAPETRLASSITPGQLNTGVTTPRFNVWCANEDKDRNGSLNTGEDINGDGVLQPRKAEIIVSYVNGNKTDQNGQMLVQVTYGQNMGSWLAYTLRTTTGVTGSEGDASKSYITDVLKDDVVNGSFLTPPFGSNACNTRN
jgi:hypothetical protein